MTPDEFAFATLIVFLIMFWLLIDVLNAGR